MDKVNRELAEWEKIYAMSKPNKGSTSSYPRNTNKSTGKKKPSRKSVYEYEWVVYKSGNKC